MSCKKKITVFDEHGSFTVELSILHWLWLKATGKLFVFHAKKHGWTGYAPFYIAKCGSCKAYFLDYPHGFRGYLECPKCNGE